MKIHQNIPDDISVIEKYFLSFVQQPLNMDFLTPEEEYELQYGEELEMMDDFDGKCYLLNLIYCSKFFYL